MKDDKKCVRWGRKEGYDGDGIAKICRAGGWWEHAYCGNGSITWSYKSDRGDFHL